jgi:cbb3-type cytochrome oxidase subunit 1
MLRTALIYLGIGFTLGALLLSNKGIPYAPLLWRLLLPHVETVLFGWTIQLIMGVAFWILPRHTREPRYGNVNLVWGAYAFLNVGIIAAALGLWTGVEPLALAGRVLELIAVMLFAIAIFPRVKAFGV